MDADTGEVDNPRPWRREHNPRVLCHGLLRCTSKKCSDDVVTAAKRNKEKRESNVNSEAKPEATPKAKARAAARAKSRAKAKSKRRPKAPYVDRPAAIMPYRIWNRDLVAVLNMLAILKSLRDGNGIPERFQRGNANALAAPQPRRARGSAPSTPADASPDSANAPTAPQPRGPRTSTRSASNTPKAPRAKKTKHFVPISADLSLAPIAGVPSSSSASITTGPRLTSSDGVAHLAPIITLPSLSSITAHTSLASIAAVPGYSTAPVAAVPSYESASACPNTLPAKRPVSDAEEECPILTNQSQENPTSKQHRTDKGKERDTECNAQNSQYFIEY
ncbi:hypothetical protein H4217_005386 [Coemansia sp. RSA 1939]|nr:hypothetical protein H4217_005386 [Coemansia sp. RSA 1939]